MRVAWLLIVLPLLAGCAGGFVGPSALDVQIKVPLGQTVTVPETAGSVRFVAVTEDSRCPANVQCLWAGLAAIELAVKVDDVETRIVLKTDPLNARAASVAGFRLEIVGLAPLPVAGQSDPLPYEVTVRVTRD